MKSFLTSRGVTLECLPIPALLEKLIAQYPTPAPPTYEVKTVTGVVEVHAHDETTLESEEDKAAWAKYQKAVRENTAKLNLALMRLVMLRGVRAETVPDEAWIKEQEFIGLSVPEDPIERQLHWLQTEALASQDDYVQLLAGVMAASGLDQEVVAQAEATFRGSVGGDPASGPAPAGNGHELAHQPKIRGNARRREKRYS